MQTCKKCTTEKPLSDSGYRSCGLCVRGLLCSQCNHGLGKFRDDPARLMAAVEYLAKEG